MGSLHRARNSAGPTPRHQVHEQERGGVDRQVLTARREAVENEVSGLESRYGLLRGAL